MYFMSILYPEVINGRYILRDSGAEDILDRLHNGDPTLGWEGDPNLQLYVNKQGRWELLRLEDDAEWHTVAIAAPGQVPDRGLIKRLVEHDKRRGFNLSQHLETHNSKVAADFEKAATEQNEEISKKLAHAYRKDGIA